MKYLMTFSTEKSKNQAENDRLKEKGLVGGHAYSVVQVKEVNVGGKEKKVLIQLLNPWGEFEWNGDWSDQSKKWEIYPDLKEKLR